MVASIPRLTILRKLFRLIGVYSLVYLANTILFPRVFLALRKRNSMVIYLSHGINRGTWCR